jgi:CRISPR type III-B/RAMP module RAMP protein Cmr1
VEIKEFKIRFITPLLIDGANKYSADSAGLTGKALRGSWRFWFRAVIGGMLKDIKNEELLLLESKIFGSADIKDLKGGKDSVVNLYLIGVI